MESLNVFHGTCFEDNYKKILDLILNNGKKRHVRGFNTLEISPFLYITDKPQLNMLMSKTRNINKAFAIAEWLWIMSGRNDAEMIIPYNKNIIQYSDDKITFNGAYGINLKSQLDYAIETLISDRYSRQAIISIWNKNPKKSKDIPCTLSFQFLVEDNKLNMITMMRSNDVWLGLPYDFFNFTMIQAWIAFKLNLEIGYYNHFVGSIHLYENNFEKARLLSVQPTLVSEICNEMKFVSNELFELIEFEQRLRVDGECINTLVNSPWVEMADILAKFWQNKKIK